MNCEYCGAFLIKSNDECIYCGQKHNILFVTRNEYYKLKRTLDFVQYHFGDIGFYKGQVVCIGD